MNNTVKRWVVLQKKSIKLNTKEKVIDALLHNRGIRTAKQKSRFINPTLPINLTLKELGIDQYQLKKAIDRIHKAKKDRQKVIVYGDYDADGVCATAIMWETLYYGKVDALPYIPERFSEGYGLNSESIKKLKKENPKIKLIISVDNGVVAHDAVKAAGKLGIDIVITDHHEKGERYPKAYAVIHTTQVCGAGLAWIVAREVRARLGYKTPQHGEGLELAAIGTVADQMNLLGPNRSMVKYGFEELVKTKRLGLKALFDEAGIVAETINTSTINYVIAPRINAMGRLHHAVESLRLVCTTSKQKSLQLAEHLARANSQRQKILEDVILHARKLVKKSKRLKIVVIGDESYHEGVIGLAASKLVEDFYRPAVVISIGKNISKASARSVSGFSIIEAVKSCRDIIINGGGHQMAAGFSIETTNIKTFIKRINLFAAKRLTKMILTPKLYIDVKLALSQVDRKLVDELRLFEPVGIGNYTPTFLSDSVRVLDIRTVGREAKHLKLFLTDGVASFEAIAFGMGSLFAKLKIGNKIDIVYSVELNNWNGNENIQLKLKDLRIA